jgi:transposase
MKEITLLAVDLAKSVFELCGVNHRGRVVYRKQVKREHLIERVLGLRAGATVAMEACGSSNHWARQFEALGYKVKLIAPQHVRAFRKSQKNDQNDAEAIAEAAQRPTMRFVAVKSQEQQVLQTAIRIREQVLRERTGVVNQLHGMLQEHGVVAPCGVEKMRSFGKRLLSERKLELPELFWSLLEERFRALEQLSHTLEEYTKLIRDFSKKNVLARRLQTLPGVGPIAAAAFVSSVSCPQSFRNGRSGGITFCEKRSFTVLAPC